MHDIDDMLKMWKSAEGISMSRTAARRLIGKREESFEERRNVVVGDKYTNWLARFTKKHNIDDSRWCDNNPDISDVDQLNMKKLWILYEAIDNYVIANPHLDNYNPHILGGNFSIEFKGQAYELGYRSAPGTCFYCDRVEYDRNDSHIDLEEVKFTYDDINQVKTEKVLKKVR